MMLRLFYFTVLLLGTIQGKSIRLDDGDDEKTPFEFDDIFSGVYSTKGLNATWIDGNKLLYTNSDKNRAIYDVDTQTSTVLIGADRLDDFGGSLSITLSADQQLILIRYNVSSVFRHSTTALYSIIDTSTNTTTHVADQNPLQIATWAPVGHGLAYVLDNNLYYLESPAAAPKAVTTNGEPGVIYNGVPDWVYEEEVLGTGSAFWFSPDGTHLAFAQFDDRDVQEFSYTIYEDLQYPKIAKIRYPKVGTVNPLVHLFVAELPSATPKVVKLDVLGNKAGDNSSNFDIFYGITWPTNSELAVLFMNRIQNEAELTRCSVDGTCNTEATYASNKGWLDGRLPKYSKDGSKRLEILPQPEEDDAFDHLVLTDVKTTEATRLTKGKFKVTSILGWDESNNVIYFGGSGDRAPSQQHVYMVDTSSLKMECLTCDWQTADGLCKYAGAAFSADLSHVAKVCQGPGPYLVELEKIDGTNAEKIVWEDNAQLRENLEKKLLPKIKDVKVKLASGFEVNARLVLPPNLDENDASKKYPAVVNVYAGPDSNQINDAYSAGFPNYIVTNRQYIYIFIDGRGSGRDGKNKMFQIYRQMGTVEIQDQIAVAKYLQDNLGYIDRNRTGIWGWSYGGFATAWVIAQDKDNVFNFGLSVAPVTNFVLYDSIYTERYMGLPTPEDNQSGYNATDLTKVAKNFAGRRFFLVHGNADDNVHYQQSMLLARALELEDIMFQQQSYPDENHSLSGVSKHLYHTIDRFWAESFGIPYNKTQQAADNKLKKQ